MQLTWPFDEIVSDELHSQLDQSLEALVNLWETRSIPRLQASFTSVDSGIGFVVTVLVIVIIIVIVIATLFAAWALVSALLKWPLVLPSRHGLHPPPGTMGWPYFGETAQLKAKRLSFYLEKRKKYGETFKSHLFGNACIVTTSWQSAKFVLVDHPELFRQRGVPSMEGTQLGVGTPHGFGHPGKQGVHLRMRKQLHGVIGHLPNIIPQVEGLALSVMRSWLGGRDVHVLHETKLFAVRASILYVLGPLPSEVNSELTKACESIIQGFNAWQVYLPWTKYYKACKGQRAAARVINQIIKERRSSGAGGEQSAAAQATSKNVLAVMMEERASSHALSERDLQETVLTLLFAAHDASAIVLTWALKYLTDDPTLFEDFRVRSISAISAILPDTRHHQAAREHDRIADGKASADLPLTWDDIKDMLVTQRWAFVAEPCISDTFDNLWKRQVIKETLRIASPIDFSCREALRDTAYDGFLIPKGWMVLVVHKTFHLHPHLWQHPHQFDAARFEVMPRPFTYTPFGNGAHVCLGRELAQLEIFIFLHHLATKFRWEECKCSHVAIATLRLNVPRSVPPPTIAKTFFIQLHLRESERTFTTDDTFATAVGDWNH